MDVKKRKAPSLRRFSTGVVEAPLCLPSQRLLPPRFFRHPIIPVALDGPPLIRSAESGKLAQFPRAGIYPTSLPISFLSSWR